MSVHFQRAAWSANLRSHILGCEHPVYRWRGPADQWEAVKERIRRAGGQFCRIVLTGGQLLVVATAPLKGAEEVQSAVAAEEVVTAIATIPVGAKRPVSACHEWKLPDSKTGEWARLALSHDIDRSSQVLAQMGVTVMEQLASPAKAAHGVQRRFLYEFPESWDELDIVRAASWAEAFTAPPGYVPGDHLPDDTALVAALMRSEVEEDYRLALPSALVIDVAAPVDVLGLAKPVGVSAANLRCAPEPRGIASTMPAAGAEPELAAVPAAPGDAARADAAGG